MSEADTHLKPYAGIEPLRAQAKRILVRRRKGEGELLDSQAVRRSTANLQDDSCITHQREVLPQATLNSFIGR